MTRLAWIPNVTAVKQALDDLDQARHIVELGLDLYAGDDNLIFPFLRLGGVGGVCVHTHVAGPLVRRMVDAYKTGDEDGARRIDEELKPVWAGERAVRDATTIIKARVDPLLAKERA